MRPVIGLIIVCLVLFWIVLILTIKLFDVKPVDPRIADLEAEIAACRVAMEIRDAQYWQSGFMLDPPIKMNMVVRK